MFKGTATSPSIQELGNLMKTITATPCRTNSSENTEFKKTTAATANSVTGQNNEISRAKCNLGPVLSSKHG